jgi:hypothetical protein
MATVEALSSGRAHALLRSTSWDMQHNTPALVVIVSVARTLHQMVAMDACALVILRSANFATNLVVQMVERLRTGYADVILGAVANFVIRVIHVVPLDKLDSMVCLVADFVV